MGLDEAGNPVIAYCEPDRPLHAEPLPLRRRRPDQHRSQLGRAEPDRQRLRTGARGRPGGALPGSRWTTAAAASPPTRSTSAATPARRSARPSTLAIDANPSLFIGGAIAQSPSGNRLAVAWPGKRGGGRRPGDAALHLDQRRRQLRRKPTSPTSAAPTRSATTPSSPSTTPAPAGSSTSTRAGLQVADLNPIAGPPPGRAAETAELQRQNQSRRHQKSRGLRPHPAPAAELRPVPAAFFAGVGKRKRKGLSKQLKGKIKFKSVVFVFDGKKLKVKKKKPFRYLIDPGVMAAGSTHVVKTKVTAEPDQRRQDEEGQTHPEGLDQSLLRRGSAG